MYLGAWQEELYTRPLSPPPPSSWPPAPAASWTGASSSTYDPALLSALQQAPPPSAYPGNGDWFMDPGASSHMASHPSILSHSRPFPPSTRIIVGAGSYRPITHRGGLSLPSSGAPVRLYDVLVSPHLITNLVSVRALTRQNPVTVEFDAFGFSVKDL